MSGTVFLHATEVEAVVGLALLAARAAWRRYGRRRTLAGVTLAIVLWELADTVLHGHATPFAQVLAFLAISVYGIGVLTDERARAALTPRFRWRRLR